MSMTYEYEPNKLIKSYKALRASASSAPPVSPSKNKQPSSLVVAAIQLTAVGSPRNDIEGFWNRARDSVREAAQRGATLILLPELFMGPYFCQSQEATLMGLADELSDNFIVKEFQQMAKDHSVVLPISLYERCNNVLYNTVVMIDADGTNLGFYRKSHIPDGIGYQEKFYFSPGDTGFKVFSTAVGKVGVAICWDQWFPEAARALALLGADVFLYPTAIGSEPQDSSLNSANHWQRTMQGHAAANVSTTHENRTRTTACGIFIHALFSLDDSGGGIESIWNRSLVAFRWK